jgi:hypothetical protein
MQTRRLSIRRLLSVAAIATLTVASAASAAFAASRAETTTYVDGNLNGVSPNTGGTLMFSDDNAMYFRTGLSTVAVPYASISHAELGGTKETSHDVPLYKVWQLNKRFSGKTQTQLLIVNFKNDAGEDKSMTLELAKSSAPGVLSLIQSRAAADAASGKTLVASAAPVAPSPEPAKLSANEPPTPESTPESKAESKKEAKAEAKEAKADAKKDNTFASKPDNPRSAWWGDDFWKTKRNTDKWNAKMSGTPGNDQR